MPRKARLDLAGVAQHVVQRGNDRQPCFFRSGDYHRYRQDLREASLKFGVQVHAYVLMTNHVHLLLTPQSVGAVGRMMQTVGRRYVRHVNDSIGRSGTLWEGRYKACLVDSERYLLTCYRYIELNPVRAGMVVGVADYPWSSYRCNGLGDDDPLIVQHPSYLKLAPNPEQRRHRYRALVDEAITDQDLAAIRAYAQRQYALGSDRFQTAIEAQLSRRARPGRPGRPRAVPDASNPLPENVL